MKRISRFCAAVLSLALVTGCANSGPAAVHEEKITLEFWTIGLKGTFSDFVQGMINDYEQAHVNTKINWVDIPGSSAPEKYLAAVAAGQAPDVANIYQMPRFAEMGALLDVAPYVPADKKADFFLGFWDALTFNGKTYGLPWYANSPTLLYSKKLMREAGLNPDKPPSTWDEALDMGKTIHAKSGKYGLSLTFADGAWFADQLLLEGLKPLSPDLKKSNVNTPEAAAIYAKWIDAYKAGSIPPEAAIAKSDDAVGWALGGRTAFFPGGAWILNRTTPEVVKQLELSVAPGLKGKAGKYEAGFQFLSVASQSKHPQEAVDFAVHVASGKYQLALTKRVAVLPSVKSGMQDDFWNQKAANQIQEATLLSAKQLDQAIVTWSSASPTSTWSQMQDFLAREGPKIFTGQSNVPDFLKATDADWNKILSAKERRGRAPVEPAPTVPKEVPTRAGLDESSSQARSQLAHRLPVPAAGPRHPDGVPLLPNVR